MVAVQPHLANGSHRVHRLPGSHKVPLTIWLRTSSLSCTGQLPGLCHGLQGIEATLTGLRKHPSRVTYTQGREAARVGGGREEPCRQWEHPRPRERGAAGVEEDDGMAGR